MVVHRRRQGGGRGQTRCPLPAYQEPLTRFLGVPAPRRVGVRGEAPCGW